MKEPTFEDYDLTESSYKKYKERINSNLSKVITIFLIVVPLTFLISYTRSDGIYIGIFFGILGIPSGLMLGFIASIIFTYINGQLNPNYNKVSQYDEQKKKYDSWWVRNQSLFWQSLSGKRFEEEVAVLYSKLGYKTELTPYSDDKGIDIMLEKDNMKIIVQCKAHKKPVGPAVLRELYGTLQGSDADSAILATTSGITKAADEFIKNKPISIVTLNEILHMRKKIEQ